MTFWFRRAENEKETAFAGAELGRVTGFTTLHVGKRELAHAASLAAAALAWKGLTKSRRARKRTQKLVRGREKRARGTLVLPKHKGFGARGGLFGGKR